MIRKRWTFRALPAVAAGAAALLVCAGLAWATASAVTPGPSTTSAPRILQPAPRSVEVDVQVHRPLARFSPREAIGAGLDGREQGELAGVYTAANLRGMSAAGLGGLTYRLRTELGVQAWHLDPSGTWSDPAHESGYWTTTSRPSSRTGPLASYGYELPRRGDTIDQADDSGYSRLDDGYPHTYWKSDPYLDSRFTHEPESRHPQWVLINLGRRRPIDALRIAWAAPYARSFRVQRYIGGPDAVALAPGRWKDFPAGSLQHGRAGTQTLRLSSRPLPVRFVRILMYSSSHTARAGATDVRDRLGYAIDEVYLGTLEKGRFDDLMTHAQNKSQSLIYTSSTDPWHSASDLNPGYEQPTFQTILRSGLTRGAPLLVPVPVLYGTPANAVAELRYLRALGVRLRGVELGEEPDGQLISPEDYGALYVQFARAIRRAFPHLSLGGPGYATSLPDWAYWPDAHGDRSWTHRFVSYLSSRDVLGLLGFFSFEWYPFDDVCAPPGPQLARASRLLDGILALQRREGIPARLPVYVTEYGYSAYAAQDEVDMPGALFDADTVGTLLEHGVRAVYLYGYEPDVPIRESRSCDTWGNLMLLRASDEGRTPSPLASFWETRMLTRDWTLPGTGVHTLYPARAIASGGADERLVHAYALRRPDGRLAILLLNLSPSQPYRVRLRVNDARRAIRLAGPIQEWQLSSANYLWHSAHGAGMPALDRPPVHTVLRDVHSSVLLAPYSITVLRAGLG